MMSAYDVARNAQPHSCPGHRFLRLLSTIKSFEDRIEFVWRYTWAMIPDRYCDGVAGLACRYCNRRLRRGILDGIAQQLPDREERPGERARVLAELGHGDMRLPGGVHEVVEHDRWVVGLFAAQGGLNALVTVHGARSGHGRGAVGSDRLSVGKGESVRAPAAGRLAQYTNKVEAHRSQGESTLDR